MVNWYYNGKEFTQTDLNELNDSRIINKEDKFTGFVYIITNETTGMKYIGKKGFYKKLKKLYVTSKRKKTAITSSDWVKYTGSSRKLNEDIASGHIIRKEILKMCTSKSSMSYYELKYQLEVDAIFKKDYYNEIINIRLSSNCVNNILKDADN